jgi:tetratricopeptide (TPR) repeat protein
MTWSRIGVDLLAAGTLLVAPVLKAQPQNVAPPPVPSGSATLTGTVRDSQNRPAVDGVVYLKATAGGRTSVARTDAQGHYLFSDLPEGTYSLRAGKNGLGEAAQDPFYIQPKESKQVDLALRSPKAAETTKPTFFDEPNFTVAGVTDSTYLGGHGSGGALRSTETLAKATANLSKAPAANSLPASSVAALEKPLRDAVDREPGNFDANYRLGKFLVTNRRPHEGLPYLERAVVLDPAKAELHQLLGDVDEQTGNSLAAVREYQRAAELDASEANLFDWGAELLVHRAVEPAIEVFTRGNRMFPQSDRMLLGLAASLYVRGDYNQAAQRFFEACDLNPADTGPYLFMAKVQSSEITRQEGFTRRLQRFGRLQPSSALAKYYYATNVWNLREEPDDADAAKVTSLLEEAVHLDPNLGVAYLQLGTVYADRKEYAKAIDAYQEAIQVSPELEQAHYRLARAYARMGNEPEAQKEMAIFEQLSKKSAALITRERSELQQFVVELRDRTTASPPQ